MPESSEKTATEKDIPEASKIIEEVLEATKTCPEVYRKSLHRISEHGERRLKTEASNESQITHIKNFTLSQLEIWQKTSGKKGAMRLFGLLPPDLQTQITKEDLASITQSKSAYLHDELF